MKKIILMTAMILCSIYSYAQEENESNEKDLNNTLKDINSSNPLPFSHQGIEKSTDENDAELNKSSNKTEDSNNGTNNNTNRNSNSDDPNRKKEKIQN